MALGKEAWHQVRITIQTLFVNGQQSTLESLGLLKVALFDVRSVKMHLPAQIGDYTDFYASKEHAVNVGTMFRGKENALMPNWYVYINL